MIDPEIFVIADVVVAGFLAVGFFAVFLFERRFGNFRCWGGGYALLAVSTATIGLRAYDSTNVWLQATACLTLFGASVLFFVGVVPPQTTRKFRKFIAVVAGITVAMLGVFGFISVDAVEWELLGHLPAALIALLASVLIWRGRRGEAKEIAMAFGLLCFAMILAVRGFWFGPIFANPDVALDADFVMQSLTMVLANVLILVGMAVTMVFHSTLATVSLLHEQSQTDGLTGLLNRVAFDEKANKLIASARKTGLPTCVLIADIDYFKHVNDTYGHQAGDQVLVAFAQVLKSVLEKDQVGGRIGGEEFAVILPNHSIAPARMRAEAIRTGLNAAELGADISASVTVSIGIAQLQPDEPLHSIMARADKALYTAKKNGRDQVQVASIFGKIDGSALSA